MKIETDTLPGSTEKFTEKDLALLKQCEVTIQAGINHFLSVGKALLTVCNKQLYEIKGYTTFEAYCKKEHNISKQHGYNLMVAFKEFEKLETVVSKDELKDVKEGTIRRLRKLDDMDKEEVRNAVKAGGKLKDEIAKVEKKKKSDALTIRYHATKIEEIAIKTKEPTEVILDALSLVETRLAKLKTVQVRIDREKEFDEAA